VGPIRSKNYLRERGFKEGIQGEKKVPKKRGQRLRKFKMFRKGNVGEIRRRSGVGNKSLGKGGKFGAVGLSGGGVIL